VRKRLMLSAIALVAAFLVAPEPGAWASLPGADGRILFSYEAPVPNEHLTQTDLFSVLPDGTGLTRLTDTPHRMEMAPAWDASGTKIVFSRSKAPFGPGSIWVCDADGSNQVRLTSGIDARDPVWDPRGARIAFSLFSTGTPWPDIATIRASDGGGLTRVTSSGGLEFLPAWSPDGTQIAFTHAAPRGDPGDIWVKDLRTGVARQVTSGPEYDLQVSWSPDGTRLVFERTVRNVARLVRVRPDGRGLTVLTRGHFDADPTYAPTGSQIVFCSDRGRMFLPDLWLMGADGGNLHRLKNLPYASTTPDWQPVI
jgi:Tol biopolymer transport system component